jgi:hypothetical protein
MSGNGGSSSERDYDGILSQLSYIFYNLYGFLLRTEPLGDSI